MAQPTHFDDLITVVTNIDRKQYGQRIVPMKVLCLGMDRTGTDSLRRALKLLGINDVYHGFSAYLENPRDCELWNEAFEAKFEGKGKPFGREQFDKLLGHCQAASDTPCICFAEDLIAAYPEAKVILTLRPVDDWYRSHGATVESLKVDWKINFVYFLGWYLRTHSGYALHVFKKAMYHMFDGEDFRVHGKRKFEEHNERIRSLVPKDRLLELHLGDGWDPLCKFLDLPRPNVDYPTGNTIASISKKFEKVFWVTCATVGKRLALYAALIGVVAGAAWSLQVPTAVTAREWLRSFGSQLRKWT